MGIGKAWPALHDTIWKSELSDGLKIGFFHGNGSNDPPTWIDGLDIDTVSRQKVGPGIHKNADSGEEWDLTIVHYKRGAVCRIA